MKITNKKGIRIPDNPQQIKIDQLEQENLNLMLAISENAETSEREITSLQGAMSEIVDLIVSGGA